MGEKSAWRSPLTGRRVYAVVEGLTEEKFVKEVMGYDLAYKGIYLIPILIGTAKERKKRGGRVNEQGAVDHVTRLLKQESETACTTCLDYYGIDEDFPGKAASRSGGSAVEKAVVVEEAFKDVVIKKMGPSFNADRFLPHVQMHEFEGILFSDTGVLALALGMPDLSEKLREIEADFDSPEDIDDSYETKPSSRIVSIYPGYQKTVDGIVAARRIGITAIRTKCPHFDSWYRTLEQL